MSKKKWSSVSAIALSSILLSGLHQGQAMAQGRCNYGRNNELQPYGDIGVSWRALGGENSPMGCPVTPEVNPSDGQGRIQTFEFGQVSWSATKGLGNHPVLIVYQAGNAIELLWAGTQPFNYDFWIVRTDSDGVNIRQEDVKTSRTEGFYVFRDVTPGQNYSFVVEGCDEVGIFGVGAKARCRQGWMNRVFITIKPNPNKRVATLPNPPARGESCFLDLKCIEDTFKQGWEIVGPIVKAVL